MLVHTKQLVQGCILTMDVMGKTSRPVMFKHTVLTDWHITVLQKFLVESVDVSTKLSDGNVFKPEPIELTPEDLKKRNLQDHYHVVVSGYQSLFKDWQHQLPVDISRVRKLVVPLLERMEENDLFIFNLSHNDPKTMYSRPVSLSLLSAYLGRKMKYEKRKWLQIGLAAFLADSGMAKIDDTVIRKETALTEEDEKELKKHPYYSYRLIEHLSKLTSEMKLAVLQHHERLDGSGYPLGLMKNNIQSYAKIISICDAYYVSVMKGNTSPLKVMDEMMKRYASKFDQQVVRTFAEQLANFSRGKKVELSNGQHGEVVFIETDKLHRPMVRMENEDIITLDTSVYIEKFLGNKQ